MTRAAAHHAKPPLQAFDWKALPLNETARALRALGTALLEHLLDPQREPDPALWLAFRWREADAERAFPGCTRFELAAPRPRRRPLKMRLVRALRGQLTLARLRMTWAPPEDDHRALRYWVPLAEHAMRDTLSESVRGRMMSLLLARRFYSKDAYLLPRYLWRTAAQLAFEAPAFRLKVAQTLDHFLRPRMTLSPALPPFELSVQTFWLLIALYQPAKPPWWRWLSPRWHRTLQMVERLSAQAHLQTRSTSWAGFWDQWVLLHRLQAEPSAIEHLNPLLRLALSRLPLLAATALDLHPTRTEATVIELAHPDYLRVSPRHFINLYPSDLWEAVHV